MSRSLLRLDLSDAARDRLVAVSALPVAVPIQAHNRIRLWRPAYDSAHSARNARINPASRLPPSGAIPFVRADIDSSGIVPQTNSPGIAWKVCLLYESFFARNPSAARGYALIGRCSPTSRRSGNGPLRKLHELSLGGKPIREILAVCAAALEI